jgi:HEAT repeat protein
MMPLVQRSSLPDADALVASSVRRPACSDLEHQLVQSGAEARRWAARDLTTCPDSAALLVQRLLLEPDASVREVILTSLTRLGEASSVQGLVQCMRSEDAALRNQAIEAMKQMPQVVAPIMHDLLRDPDSDMRIFAVNILESLRHPEVEKWLIDVIERDAHVNVCATAVDLLGEVGSASAVAPLQRLKMRFQGETYIQFAADLALRRIQEN